MPSTPDQPVRRTLTERYADRKHETFARLGAFAQADVPDDIEATQLLDLLHKLAGTAGMFGEADLGEQAGELEAHLENWLSSRSQTAFDAFLSVVNANGPTASTPED